MPTLKQTSASLLLLAGAAVASPAPRPAEESVFFRVPDSVSSRSVHNVHVSYGDKLPRDDVRVVYGDCASTEAGQSHHDVASIPASGGGVMPDRLVWSVPEDTAHANCLSAYSGSKLVGRSDPVSVSGPPLRRRESLHEVGDSNGLWFDGVRYLETKNQSATVSAEAKSKSIAIIGGGMSGLMTSLLLTSVGINDWHIIESTERLGGRVRTKYLNGTSPEDYQYQEMGPMRFPVSVEYADTNQTLDIQDHKMVFQLAEVLNKMNGKDHPELAVNFIPFVQNNPAAPTNSGGGRLPNGRIPSGADIAADPSLNAPPANASDPTAAEQGAQAWEEFVDATPDRLRNVSANIFKAHREAIDKGLFHWSETAYLRYHLGLDADTVDFLSGSGNTPAWGEWYDTAYFSAANWLTIDKGLNSLPNAFAPHVEGKITYGRKVEGLTYDDSGVSVNWREDEFSMQPKSEEYDYAIVSVPFSKVRLWRMPEYSSLLSRAISTLHYHQSCKVALHYETRFWEAQEKPIYGGCGSVDIPGIDAVCYPSYKINSTGPGVILGSYSSGSIARSLAALSEKDHVALVQRAMVEIHGEVASEQFTGSYERQCWEVDEHQAGSWASPTTGQQELFIPAYHNTEFNTIFVGEHTSITHAWIFSALESSVRGTTQLLLDLGLVDEAKEIVDTWMARWITV